MVRGTRVLAGAFALVGVIGALSAAPAAAQSGFSFTPWAGAYVPTRNSFSTVGSDIRRDYYPDLSNEDIRACVQYAIDLITLEDIHVAESA